MCQKIGLRGDVISTSYFKRKMPDREWDVRDVMISGTCERCERTHVDMEYQHDAEEWLCVYCLEQE